MGVLLENRQPLVAQRGSVFSCSILQLRGAKGRTQWYGINLIELQSNIKWAIYNVITVKEKILHGRSYFQIQRTASLIPLVIIPLN